jgi:exodeoxyribonuclease VII small subunit
LFSNDITEKSANRNAGFSVFKVKIKRCHNKFYEHMATAKKISYTDSLKELEEILAKLESQDISLEELSPLVKKASLIIDRCKQQLFDTDTEIQQMLDDIN